MLDNFVLVGVPCLLYALVIGWRLKVPIREIPARLGLQLGVGRVYLMALAASIPVAAVGVLISSLTSEFKGSMIKPFVGAAPSLAVLGNAISYALLTTGLPEELLFRGLIAGALFRHHSFWRANLIQALIFMLPHLLILLVAPELWYLAVPIPLALGLLLGWLRHTSGSIGPAIIVHTSSNIAGALAVLNWT